MEFEKAIENASTLFLFDLRTQQMLHEMAESAPPRSRDRALIRLSQAAFLYYNAVATQVDNVRRPIRQASQLLAEAKRYRENRVLYTLALRLEVDLLMHESALQMLETAPGQELSRLYNEGDQRALAICETLLRNLPTSFDPLPHQWYSGVIPLFPPFQEQTLNFYRDRIQENRIVALAGILRQVRRELTAAAGLILTKRYLVEHRVQVQPPGLLRNLFRVGLQEVLSRAEAELPNDYQLHSDIVLPKKVSPSELELALRTVQEHVDQAKRERDIRKYTGSLLHMGILHFLQESNAQSVHALMQTLRASRNIDPGDKQQRMYRHEEFPDIPFMIGTCYLRMRLRDEEEERSEPGDGADLLGRGKAALMQAVTLNHGYHQAYNNLALAVSLEGRENPDEVIRLYVEQFDRRISAMHRSIFRNRALWEYRQARHLANPDMVKWLLIGSLGSSGETSEGRKMLQELKTLYVLNAHDYMASYLETYRTHLRVNNESFVQDLHSDQLHSAILFYIAHGLSHSALAHGRDEADVRADLDRLDRGIDLNAESLYFHRDNSSARRLVNTQAQLLAFLLRRSEKRWENINTMLGQRFQLYEEFLRQQKSYELLRERLSALHLEELVPEVKISQTALLRMDGTITEDQRRRIRERVMSTAAVT